MRIRFRDGASSSGTFSTHGRAVTPSGIFRAQTTFLQAFPVGTISFSELASWFKYGTPKLLKSAGGFREILFLGLDRGH